MLYFYPDFLRELLELELARRTAERQRQRDPDTEVLGADPSPMITARSETKRRRLRWHALRPILDRLRWRKASVRPITDHE